MVRHQAKYCFLLLSLTLPYTNVSSAAIGQCFSAHSKSVATLPPQLLSDSRKLLNHFQESIGSKARFEFRAQPPIEGHVVFGHFHPHDHILVIDNTTGMGREIALSGDSAPVKILETEAAPKFAKHGVQIQQAGENAIGLIEIRVSNSLPGKGYDSTYIYGKVRRIEGSDTAFEIDTLNGIKHKADTRFARILFNPDPSAQKNPKPWSQTNTQVISIYDSLENERREWARKITDKKMSPLKNPEYYNFLEKHIGETRTVVERWYGPHAHAMLTWVERELGKRFIPLLTDPGLANHFEKFQTFASKTVAAKPNISLPDLRQAFSDSLGKIKVFRGMVLSDQEVNEIQKTGIASRLFLTSQRDVAFSDYMGPLKAISGEPLYPLTPMESILKKYSSGNLDQETLQTQISTSTYPEVAETAGFHSAGVHWSSMAENNKAMYVFELEIPILDLIRTQGLFKNHEEGAFIPYVIDGKVFNMADDRIEFFTPFWLEPDAIQNIRILKKKPSQAIMPFTPDGIERSRHTFQIQQQAESPTN